MLREAQRNFEKQLVDDNRRIDIQFLIAYFLFFVIAIVMSIVNFLTGNVLLMAMTLAFATLCIFNFALSRISSKCATVASLIFCVEFFALFVQNSIHSVKPSRFSLLKSLVMNLSFISLIIKSTIVQLS